MSAWLFPLEQDLQEAVEQGVLTISEAWLLMDDRLMRSLLMGESRSLPDRLYPLLEMLFLVQAKPPTPSLH